MIFITIILILASLLLLTHLYFLKKEIKRVTKQLYLLREQKNAKKIDISYFDKELEDLASEINKQIDLTKSTKVEKQRSEDELKQAIANMSHDIRTPLTSILGYIQLLESDELTIQLRKQYTSTVKSRALRLNDLLDDFFELSIIDAPDYPLNTERVKLNHLIIEILVGFYEEFKQREIEPVIDIPEEVIIKTDPSAVKRVIENLLFNTVKHSSGNVSIHIKKLGSVVQLIISNNVTELDEDNINCFFERFYKADTARSEKGAGLGLFIAKSLMVKMDGNLTAQLRGGELSMICEWRNQ